MRFRAFALSLLLATIGLSSADPLVSVPPDAVPDGARLEMMYGNEWLPEPLQTRIYQAPAVGSPVSGCLSVVRMTTVPEHAALRFPVRLEFACDQIAEHAVPFAYQDGQWIALPSENDHGRIVVMATALTTYALLKNQPNS